MNNRVITLISDYSDNFSSSQIELIIHSINPLIKFIVAENDVTLFSIIEGAFILFSQTFHGRDVFAKVAGYISKGKNPLHFCTPLAKVNIKPLIFKKNQVLHIDPYGNIKFNSISHALKIGDRVNVSTEKRGLNVLYCRTFSDVAPGKFLLYEGSHQTLELATNLGSAAKVLNTKVGDILQIQKL